MKNKNNNKMKFIEFVGNCKRQILKGSKSKQASSQQSRQAKGNMKTA